MAKLKFTVQADYSKLVELRREITKLENQIKNLNLTITPKVDVQGLERQLTALRGQYQKLHQSISMEMSGASRDMGKVSSSARDVEGALKSLSSSSNGVSVGIQNFTRQFATANLTLMAIYKTIGMIKGSMQTIMSFEAENARLGAIASMTADDLEYMKERAQDLGRTTVYTASQVTQLQIELAKLGFQKDAIDSMQESVLGFAQATGSQLADAAATAGAALRMFGLSSNDVEENARNTARVVNAMSSATMASALNFQAISDNLAQFGPVAKQIGFEIEDALALFGAIKNAGVDGSVAATSLRNIFNEMAGGKLQAKIGYTVNNIETFRQALRDLAASGFQGAEGVKNAMKDIGKRGGAQFLSLIQAENANEIEQIRNRILEGVEQGKAGDMGEKMINNLAGSIKILQSAWEGFVLQFSESDGAIKSVVDTISSGINGVTDMMKNFGGISSQAMKDTLVGVELLVGALATYKLTMMGINAYTALGKRADVMTYEAIAKAIRDVRVEEQLELDTNLQASVASGRLTQERAVAIQGLINAERQKAIAERESALATEQQAMTTLQEVALEREKAVQAVATAEQELALTKQKITAEQQLGNADRVAVLMEEEKAQAERLSNLEKAKNIALMHEQVATTNLSNASKASEVATTNADAVAQRTDALMKDLNTKSTSRLTAAMDMLGLSMLKNPYVLAAAAIVAVGVAIYDNMTAVDAHTAAVEGANSVLKEFNDLHNEHASSAMSYQQVLADENATLYQQRKAYEDLIKVYKEFEGYTMDEVVKMAKNDPDKFKQLVNQGKDREELEDQDKFIQAIKEMTAYYNSGSLAQREGLGWLSTAFNRIDFDENTWSEGQMFDYISEKYGEKVAEQIKAVTDQTGFLGNKTDYLLELLKEVETQYTDISKAQGKTDSATMQNKIKSNKDELDILKEYVKFYEDKAKGMNDESTKAFNDRINNRIEELSKVYGDAWKQNFEKKFTEAKDNGDEVERLNTLKNLLNDIEEEYMRLNDINITDPFESMELDAETGDDIIKILNDVTVSCEEYQKAKDGMSPVSLDISLGNTQKVLDDQLDNIQKKIDDIKSTKNYEFDVKAQFKVSEYEKTMQTIQILRTALDNASEPRNAQIIVDYLQGKYEVAPLPDGTMPQWGDQSAPWGGKLTLPTDMRRTEGITNRVKKENKDEENNDKREADASAFNEAERKRKEQHKYEELLKEIGERRKEAEWDLEHSITEARVQAMAEGEERAREQRKLDHEKEVKQIKDQGKKRLDEYIKQQKQLFEADPSNKGESAKKGGKDGKGARGGKKVEFFDEEEFKKSEEYLAYQAKVMEEENAKILAMTQKYQEDISKDYTDATQQRKREVNKIKSDIDALEELRSRLNKIVNDVKHTSQGDLDIYASLLKDPNKKFDEYTEKEKEVFVRLKDFSVEEISTFMGMTDDQVKVLEDNIATLTANIETAQNKLGENDRKSKIDYFTNYGTDAEKRLAVQEKFAMEREKIAKDDTYAILKNKRDEQKALNELERKIYEDSELFRSTMEDPSHASAKSIQTLIEHLNDKLQSGIKNGNLDYKDQRQIIEDINKLKEKMFDVNPIIAYKTAVMDLTEAEEKLKTLQMAWNYNSETGMYENALSLETMSKEQYDDSILALQNKKQSAQARVGEAEKGIERATGEIIDGLVGVGDAFADAFGDETGEKIKKITNALSVCWQSFQTMTENIQKFTESMGKTMETATEAVNKTAEGMEKGAAMGTQALTTMEKASAILAIIGAAVQAITVISSLVSDSHDIYEKHAAKRKEITDLTDAVNAYKLAVIDANNAEKEWFNASGLEGLRDAGDKASQVMQNYNTKISEAQEEYKNQGAGWKKAAAIAGGAIAGAVATAATIATGGIAGVALGTLAGAAMTAGGAVAGSALALGNNLAYKNGQTSARNNLRMETRKKNFWHGQKTQNLEDWAKQNLNINLFGEDGSLNLEGAQTILEKYGDKLVGQTKETLEYLVQCQEEYNEFLDQVKDYTSQMFSPLVDNMTDALWNWLETGQDVLYSFHQSASQTFQAIAKDMIKNLVNKHIFDGYEDELSKLTESYALGGMKEEEYTQKVLELTNMVEDRAEMVMPTLQSAAENIANIFEGKGYDVVNGGEATAGAKAFGAMSQDVGEVMNGRLGALQIAVEDIRGTIKLFSWDIVTKPLDMIDTHISESALVLSDARDILANTYLEVVAIRQNTDAMVESMTPMKTYMYDVKRNTEGLIR